MPYCLSRPILLYTNIENNLKNMESFILLSQPSWIYFIVCCVILLKPSHLISILRMIWKIFSLPFCFAGHLGFILVCCRSSSQTLSFDTHIECYWRNMHSAVFLWRPSWIYSIVCCNRAFCNRALSYSYRVWWMKYIAGHFVVVAILDKQYYWVPNNTLPSDWVTRKVVNLN